MQSAPAGNLLEYLGQIPDPRGRQGRRFPLSAMLATVVCAVLCGARGYAAMAQWIHAQDPAVWYLLGYFRRPPGATGLRKLLLRLSPEALEEALRKWVLAILGETEGAELLITPLDGKSLGGTLEAHGRAIHLLSLLDQKTGCVLQQWAVPSETNEAKAALPVLRTLVLEGRVVTGDAMFCQKDVCQTILDSGGDYFVVVKDNQPTLQQDIAADFEPGFSPLQREATPSPAL